MVTTPSKGAAWLTASAVMAASAVPASGEVYLNEAQALAIVLGERTVVRKELKTLDDALRTRLERSSNLRFPESSYTFFIAARDGQAEKYAIQMNEIGKTEPITFMVGMSPEGKVTDVVIMVFRENRGWEVKEKRFLNQFRGKTLRNSIRVDEDIINYTGATLSSKAVARGVKRALFLLDTFYSGEARYKLAAANQFALPLPMSPILTTADLRGSMGLYRQSRYAMGSICEIRLWCRSAGEAYRAFAIGFGEIDRMEQVFSAYRKDSELALVNGNAGGGPVQVSEKFFDLTKYAVGAWRQSGGSVDVTVGPLMKAWGFREGEPHLPLQKELLEAQELVGCNKLSLDRRTRTVRFLRQGMQLDFGGLAKGHAAKRIARVLKKQGVSSALVNLGGSSLCASEVVSSATPQNCCTETGIAFGEWLIGVIHPSDAKQCPVYLLLKPGWSISTSGTPERQFEFGGQKLSHILDPRTGWPLSGLRSATAVARSGRRSEVLSKCLLLQSAEKSTAIASQFKDFDWVYLEKLPTGALKLEANSHRTKLYTASARQSQICGS
jgi:thiamine biosynthesis lipoprotein ApbE/Na+-translocating ferredoxin:NAD+ oxidoreductase RnfG subunit